MSQCADKIVIVDPAPLAQEIGSRLSTRIEGRCIKHYMGAAGVKVYDKFSRVLRVETTVNDVSFFKHHRKVEHKDRHSTRELALLKKSAEHRPLGDVAPDQATAPARSDQEGLAYLSLLPHPIGPRGHRRRLLAHAIQQRSGHGCCTLKSSQDLSRLNFLETNDSRQNARLFGQ